MAVTRPLTLAAPSDRRARMLGPLFEAARVAAETAIHPVVLLPLFLLALTSSLIATGSILFLYIAAGSFGYTLAGVRRAGPLASVTQVVLGAFHVLLLLILAAASVLVVGAASERTLPVSAVLVVSAMTGSAAAKLRAELTDSQAPNLAQSPNQWLLIGSFGGIAVALVLRAARAGGDTGSLGFFALCFALAAAVTVTSVAASLALRPASTPPTTSASSASRSPVLLELLADNLSYGRLLLFQIVYNFGALADPFFVIYAQRELNAGSRAVLGFLLILVITRTAVFILLHSTGASLANRALLQLAAFVRLGASIAALTLPPLLGSAVVRTRLAAGGGELLAAYGLVFVALGAAGAIADRATPGLIASITAARERRAAMVVSRLTYGATAAVFILGALVADRLGYPFLFIGSLLLGLAALLSSGLVDGPDLIVLRPPASVRHDHRRRH